VVLKKGRFPYFFSKEEKAMDIGKLFEMALSIQDPWYVKELTFNDFISRVEHRR